MADTSRRDRSPRWMPGATSARTRTGQTATVAVDDVAADTADDAGSAAEITTKMPPVASDGPVEAPPATSSRPVELFGWTKSGKNGPWVRTRVPASDGEPAPEKPASNGAASNGAAATETETPAAPAAPVATKSKRRPGPPPPPNDAPDESLGKDTSAASVAADAETGETPSPTPAVEATIMSPKSAFERPAIEPASEPQAIAEPQPALEPMAEADLMAEGGVGAQPDLAVQPTVLVPQAAPVPPVVVTPLQTSKPKTPVGGSSRPSSTVAGKRKPSGRRSRHARLRVSHIGVGSFMRTALMFSVALGIVFFVATAIVWMIIDNSGVLGQAQSMVDDIVGAGGTSSLQLSQYLDTQRVLGFALSVSVANVILMTLFAGILAALYNAVATIFGGVMVTLSED